MSKLENISLVDVAEGDGRENDLVETGAGRVDGDDDFTVEKVQGDQDGGDRGHHCK